MKLSAFATFALMFSFLSGCASKPPVAPDWISGDSVKYSSAQYLMGRGQAVPQEEARDRARADLAKIFQVAVIAESEDVQKFKTDPAGPGQYESHASRSISTRTEQIIRGIQIAELWQDPVSNILAFRDHRHLEYLGKVCAGAIPGFFLGRSLSTSDQVMCTAVLGAVAGDPVG